MDTKTFIDAYLGCRSNKRRSPDSVYFELHWERDLKRLELDFDDRSLVSLLYAFVAPRPRPREVIACLMQGKILQYYFDINVRPKVENELTDRTYIGNRVVRNAKKHIENWNGHVSKDNIDHFIASINSYTGQMKHHAAYNIIRDLVDNRVSPKWLKYVHFNEDRLCFQANDGYTHNELLQRKYHFKLHRNGKPRKTQHPGVAAA